MNAVQLLIDTIVRYNLLRHPRIEIIFRQAQRGQISDFQARGYINWLEPMVQQQRDLFNPLHRPPQLEQLYPEGPPPIQIGKLVEVEGVPCGLPLRGACFATFSGRAGSGKTTGLRRSIIEIDAHNRLHRDEFVSLIVIDRKGGDFSDLPEMLGRDQWLHFDVRQGLLFGLDPPPGVPPNVWASRVATCFCARAGLEYGSVSLLDTIVWLAAVLNPLPADEIVFPSFQLLLDVIEAAPDLLFSSKESYRASVIQQLRGAIISNGEVFSAMRGLDLQRDVIAKRKNCVITAPNLEPPMMRQFLVDMLLSKLILARREQFHRVDRLDTMFVIDEGEMDASERADKVYPDGLSPIAECLKQSRELGIGILLGFTTLLGASKMILANATHQFVFGMSDKEGIENACAMLCLPYSAKPFIVSLPQGRCLFRQAGAWPHATLSEIDYVAPNRAPRPDYSDPHPFVPGKRLHEMPEVQKALQDRAREAQNSQLRRTRIKKTTLDELSTQFVRRAAENPYMPVARVWELLGTPSFAKQMQVRKKLEKLKFATYKQTRIDSANVLLVWLTDEGWVLSERNPPEIIGRGDLDHRVFAFALERCGILREFEARREALVEGSKHIADTLWITKEGRVRVFEVIADCHQNIASHVRESLLVSKIVSDVTIVAGVQKDLEKARGLILGETELWPLQDRIRYEGIAPYLREAFPCGKS